MTPTARILSRAIYFFVFCGIVLGVNLASSKQRMNLEGEFVEISREDVVLNVTLRGQIEPRVHAKVKATLDGDVGNIAVELGDKVRKGQVLLEIQNDEAESELFKLEDRVLEMRKEMLAAKNYFEGKKALFKSKSIKRSEVDDAYMDYLMSQRNLAIVEEEFNLKKEKVKGLQVVSPISGEVVDVRVDSTQRIIDGAILFEIINFDEYIFRGRVDKDTVARIDIDQNAVIRTRALANIRMEGRVERKEISVSTEQQELNDVFIEILNQSQYGFDQKLAAQATIITGRVANGIVIPKKSIHNGEQGPVVFSPGIGGWLNQIPVTVSQIKGDRVVIANGLAPGQVVLVPKTRP